MTTSTFWSAAVTINILYRFKTNLYPQIFLRFEACFAVEFDIITIKMEKQTPRLCNCHTLQYVSNYIILNWLCFNYKLYLNYNLTSNSLKETVT